MLTCSIVLLHDNARPHTNTAACIWALLEYFNWELFDRPLYSPDLAPNDYHLFTYLKISLRWQRFDNNELMDDVKTWPSSQVKDFFEQAYKNSFPSMTSVSIPVVTTMRSKLITYDFCI
jgi:transposase